MFLEIITPEKKLFAEEITALTVQTLKGQITILPHHEDLVTQLVSGAVALRTQKGEQLIGVTGGFLEISNNHVTILADYAIKAEDIVVEKALAAQKRAEEILKKSQEGVSHQNFAIAQADMQRASMELHIANRRKLRSL